MKKRDTGNETESLPPLSPGIETLLTEQIDAVFRFCLRLCGGKTADAEDLTQDVFVLAWENRGSFAGRSRLTTWLMRIALNRHFRVSRSPRSKEKSIDTPGRESTDAITEDPAEQTVERLELTRALEALPDPLRAAFLLVKVEGLKYKEAAEVLGIPTGTVQWQVHEAVQQLRAALASPEDFPTPRSEEAVVARSSKLSSKEALIREL